MVTTANPTLTKIDTARVASVQSGSVLSRGSTFSAINTRNTWSLESGVATGNVSSAIDKFMNAIPQDFGWRFGTENPVKRKKLRIWHMPLPIFENTKIYGSYTHLYCSLREKDWRDLVKDLLMSKLERGSWTGEDGTLSYHFIESNHVRHETERRSRKYMELL